MIFRLLTSIKGRLLIALAAAAGVLLGFFQYDLLHAAERNVQEEQLKTAFIYNFTKFVEWPADAFTDSQAPFRICLLGNDPLMDTMDVLKTKQVGKRSIIYKRISSIKQLHGCQILFIGSSEKDSLPRILKEVHKKEILTISDTNGFADAGVMINLQVINNRMGFEINREAVEQTSLKFSSKLLKLGKLIK